MGTCELFLEPQDVSLKRHFLEDAPKIIVGALLERQIQSLEPSRYKPAVKKTISMLLTDALDVYSLDESMPLRRAGIWLKWLEGLYFGGTELDNVHKSVQSIGEEVQQLLSKEVILMHY